jgi:hypothetical protein
MADRTLTCCIQESTTRRYSSRRSTCSRATAAICGSSALNAQDQLGARWPIRGNSTYYCRCFENRRKQRWADSFHLRGDRQKVTGFEGTDLPDFSAARVHQIRKAVSVIAHCCRAGLRALRSTDDPGLDQFPGGFLISRSGFAAFSGIPSPSHQIVLGNMLLQHR